MRVRFSNSAFSLRFWVVGLKVLAVFVFTLTTNLAANMVAPDYGFSNMAPSKISFRMGGYITAGIGVAIFP